MSGNRNALISSVFLLIVVTLTNSCASKKDTGVTERSVNGILERVYHDPTPPAVDPYLIEESTLFGTDQGGDTYLLTLPSPHTLADDGTLYVIDARQTAAHMFSPDGRHLGQFGRKGQGPGEFQVLQDLTLDDGKLYTNDPFGRRITVMNLDGSLIEVVSFPDDVPVTRFIVPYGFEDGRGYILIEKDVRYPFVQEETPRTQFLILHMDHSLKISRTLLDSIGTFQHVMLGERPLSQPFASLTPATGIAPDMPIAWSYGHEFRIDFMDPDDLTRWAVTIPHEPLPVSNEIKEREIAMYDRLSRSTEASSKLSFPGYLPHIAALDDLRWDLSGRLWVLEYRDSTVRESPYRFYVFSKDGRWLFRQDFPKRPWLISEEGFYTRASDDEGNPLVQFNRFVKKQ